MIEKFVEKPSEAVFAMVQGLKDHKKYNLKIHMSDYMHLARNDDNTLQCYGCAATAALSHIFKPGDISWFIDVEMDDKTFKFLNTPDTYDRYYFWKTITGQDNMAEEDVKQFELAIEHLRIGRLDDFLKYFDITTEELHDKGLMPRDYCDLDNAFSAIWHLDDDNWITDSVILKRIESWGETLQQGGY